eukprot:g7340.t1
MAEEKSWDDLAETWDQEKGVDGYSFEVLKELKSRFPRLADSVVLDFGAGTGTLTTKLVEEVAEIVAMDLSEKMILKLKEKLPQLETYAIDIKEMPISLIGRFDLVVASSVFHFVEDLKGTLSKIVECLRYGGSVAQFDWPNEDEENEDHGNGFNDKIIKKVYNEVGLELKEAKRVKFNIDSQPCDVFLAIGQKK